MPPPEDLVQGAVDLHNEVARAGEAVREIDRSTAHSIRVHHEITRELRRPALARNDQPTPMPAATRGESFVSTTLLLLAALVTVAILIALAWSPA
jgi:hypothetical protein